MQKDYSPLAATPLAVGATFHLPLQESVRPVMQEDPAVDVMTDFQSVRVITTPPGVGLDQAYQRMISNGVRLLLVVDERNTILGVLTARDVEGERPVQLVVERGVRRAELTVADVMTHRDRIEVLQMVDVMHARVGDVVATLKAMGRQHAMVIDRDGQGGERVRGLFSATRISRQLSQPIHTVEVARSFAHLTHMLSH